MSDKSCELFRKSPRSDASLIFRKCYQSLGGRVLYKVPRRRGLRDLISMSSSRSLVHLY